MAYEVTKRIKGHDYRYLVEGYRDPGTGRAKAHWHYLGRIAGSAVVTPARRKHDGLTRDRIVACAQQLLQSRDASRVTVSVIAHAAGVSTGTFYRYFPNRKRALFEAFAHICDDVFELQPSLDEPLGSREEESRRLRAWLEALFANMLQQRAVRWFVAEAGDSANRRIIESARKIDSNALLLKYLLRLQRAGFISTEDVEMLASGIMHIIGAFLRASLLPPDESHCSTAKLWPIIERAVFA